MIERSSQDGDELRILDDTGCLTPEVLCFSAELPPEQRAAVELQLAGWSGEQIAAALGRSPAAVKMLRFRALQRLRTALVPTAGSHPNGDER